MRGKVVKGLIIAMVAICTIAAAISAVAETDLKTASCYQSCSRAGTGGGYGGGCFAGNEMSDEQIVKISRERDKLLKSTSDIRNKIYEKRKEMAEVISRENPDESRLETLQKDLSELMSEFDQKHIAFILAVKKIAPKYGTASRPGNKGGGRPSCCPQQ
jgi:Spy/CpxP family protein refolding chaperone